MIKKILKWTFLVLLVAFIIIQFIRPKKNTSSEPSANAIENKYPIPEDVKSILKTSCYDCHSNNTVYPWYAEVQPFGWWLAGHISDGKKDLNFDEFLSYRIYKQYKRLDDIVELVKDNKMPIASYLWIHKYAKLDDQKKQKITDWANGLRTTIAANNPPDSLKRPQQNQAPKQ